MYWMNDEMNPIEMKWMQPGTHCVIGHVESCVI